MEMVEIEVKIGTGYVGCSLDFSFNIYKESWEAMSDYEKTQEVIIAAVENGLNIYYEEKQGA